MELIKLMRQQILKSSFSSTIKFLKNFAIALFTLLYLNKVAPPYQIYDTDYQFTAAFTFGANNSPIEFDFIIDFSYVKLVLKLTVTHTRLENKL
jgi:hypothetical protein